MSLSTQVLSLLKLRQPKPRRSRADTRSKPMRSSIPRWLGGSSSSSAGSASGASRPRPRTPPGVIYIPELPEDGDLSDDDYCQGEDEDDSYMSSARSHRSVFSSTSRASARLASSVDTASPSLAQSLKRTSGKLHSLVHRALHPDKPRRHSAKPDQSQGRSSIIKALASRLSVSSASTCTTTSSQCNSGELDDCADVEDAILRDNKDDKKVEFLFFPGCPDNLNVYELEVNQYRRRTNFASSPPSAEKQAPPPPPPSAAETIAVGPTIVRSMPPLFAPRLRRGVSSNLLVGGGAEDYDGVHTW